MFLGQESVSQSVHAATGRQRMVQSETHSISPVPVQGSNGGFFVVTNACDFLSGAAVTVQFRNLQMRAIHRANRPSATRSCAF